MLKAGIPPNILKLTSRCSMQLVKMQVFKYIRNAGIYCGEARGSMWYFILGTSHFQNEELKSNMLTYIFKGFHGSGVGWFLKTSQVFG